MTEQVSPTYEERIAVLHQTKRDYNDYKIETYGTWDVDDHGAIPWPEAVPFEAIPTHEDGGVYGTRGVGLNFRRWLEVHPVYINPHSALAGAWIQYGIPGVFGAGPMVPLSERKPRKRPAKRQTQPACWRPEDRPVDQSIFELQEKYNHYCSGVGGANHLGPDMRIGLDLGWGGLLAKLRRFRTYNHPVDTSFYDGEEDFVLGMQTWIRRHVTLAREMAAQEENPTLKQNLLEIADMNEWLVDNPPRTLREAFQFLAWFQSVDRMWATGGALDQIDRLLQPYYDADVAAGRITDDEQVVWYIASLFFNDTHYSQIGGQGPDGTDLTCKMSFLVLEAMHQLAIPCNIALRVWDGMNLDLLRKAVENHVTDGTGVSFALSKGLDEGFMRQGHPVELARMRAKVGCNWTALPGIEYPLQDVTRLCLITPLLFALDELMTLPEPERTPDYLWERYSAHLAFSVDVLKQGKDYHMERHARNFPEIVLNLFCHGPVERGLDVAAGGVNIVDLAVDGIGLATAADSWAAIEQRVVKEKRLSWDELMQHLDNDFKDAEDVRLMLNSVPRYGSGKGGGDIWAKRIADLWDHLVSDTPTPRGYRMVPGLFSHGNTDSYGHRLPATPNGRHAGAPTSHSADPDPGFAPGGAVAATAKAAAVANVQPRWGNTTPLQIEFDSKLAKDMGGVDALMAFILAHNEQGGTLINMNVISKETILEAHEDVMTHPDLVMRVTGYSAFFRSLSREYRQPIVDRVLAEE